MLVSVVRCNAFFTGLVWIAILSGRVQGQECREYSVTTVNKKRVCKGQVVLNEEFDTLDPNMWAHEVEIPWEPSHLFNIFDKDPANSYTEAGKLVIKPTLFDDDFVRYGKLDLAGCTGRVTEECKREGRFGYILPPIKSARITTKNSFSFKYGKIEVRSKFPKGDWIIPELWMNSQDAEYGPGLQSGGVFLAVSRGNTNLKHNGEEIGSTLMQFGVLMTSGNMTRVRSVQAVGHKPWYNDFHTTEFNWRPDGMNMYIDGQPLPELLPKRASSLTSYLGFPTSYTKIWSKGAAVAPFDKEFYISLGLSIGGVREYADNAVSGNYKKPWSNTQVKNKLAFWEARDKWLPTWDEERTKLQILSIKVTAL